MISSKVFILAIVLGIMLVVCNSQPDIAPNTSKKEHPNRNQTDSRVNPNEEKRHLTILYEALCPDSERFMEQLGPVYEDFKDFVQLEFVPFGLTKLVCKHMINGKCVRPVFICKHGPAGCYANRQHSCALQYSSTPGQKMNFITCTMGPYKAPVDKCLALLGYSQYDVDTCMTFDEGTELQLIAHQKTVGFKSLKVPVILFDGQFVEEFSEAAIRDFRALMCRLLSTKYAYFNELNAPKICQSPDVFPNLSQ